MKNLIAGLRFLAMGGDNDLVIEAECGVILIEKPLKFCKLEIEYMEGLNFILKDDTFHYYLV